MRVIKFDRAELRTHQFRVLCKLSANYVASRFDAIITHICFTKKVLFKLSVRDEFARARRGRKVKSPESWRESALVASEGKSAIPFGGIVSGAYEREPSERSPNLADGLTIAGVENRRFMVIAGVTMLLSVLPLLLWQRSPEARAANRIYSEYSKAEKPVLGPESGLADAEQFAADLKRIRLDDTPPEVRQAMASLIAAVEARVAMGTRGNTNAANDRVADARKSLVRALEKHRGQPF